MGRNRLPFVGVVLALALLVGGYAQAKGLTKGEVGSGRTATSLRKVPPFQGVKLRGACDVRIRAGRRREVRVRGDDNLVGSVATRVVRGRLEIVTEPNIRPIAPLVVEISIPELNLLELEGAGDIFVQGLRSDSLRIDLRGAGDVTVKGEARKLELGLHGAGDIRLRELRAAEATVRLNGAGNIELNVGRRLLGDLHGAGDVIQHGAAQPQIDIQGAGAVRRGR